MKTFNPMPEPAYYFSEPSDAIYDITAGSPYIDWEHIIVENCHRIPPNLLARAMPGFRVQSCRVMTEVEFDLYRQQFSDFLRSDGFAYQGLIAAFERALKIALQKVRWNYKTAIPIYYPALNRLSILLPLCLLSDEEVNLALVVEKTGSGLYQGQTILPLDWAYSNARLIARPNSDWLQADKILQIGQ